QASETYRARPYEGVGRSLEGVWYPQNQGSNGGAAQGAEHSLQGRAWRDGTHSAPYGLAAYGAGRRGKGRCTALGISESAWEAPEIPCDLRTDAFAVKHGASMPVSFFPRARRTAAC